MTVTEIAEQLVTHCRDHTELEGLETLYAPDAVSVEAMPGGTGERETHGIDGIRGKHAWWDANFEVHSGEVDGPYVNGDAFSVMFEMDATEKATGQRWQMKEVALYEVANGKIVRESFFNAPMPE